MADMSVKKTAMPEQEPDVRNKNFNEVALGYTLEMAQKEAARCLMCKNRPCMAGCPVFVDIPGFIKKISEGKIDESYMVLHETNSLPAVCGRVCPQETQCEERCVRGIKGEPVAIGRLERYAADWFMANACAIQSKAPRKNIRIAVIGSGPAGLTCAGDLSQMGYDVTIFEAFHTPGGVLKYGIPEFRLPKEIVQKEIDWLKENGVKIQTNMVIGKILSLDEIFAEGYKAIFIGTGAGLPSFMKIPGENLNGVYSSNELLTRINLMKAYKFPITDTPVVIGRNTAVVGGGNVAMDAARCAKRMGAENVYIIYRRSMKEMPARVEEIHHAEEEGIIFKLLTNPVEIIGDEEGRVKAIKLIEMELGEPDESGRRRPVPKLDSEYELQVDSVVIAIGQTPNPLIPSTTPELKVEKWGGIIIGEETGETNIPGVYAGGDAVSGAATVINAMGAGKKAAVSIDKYINETSKL